MDHKFSKSTSIQTQEGRYHNVVEIYNEEMSPTSVSLAYDEVLQKKVAIKKIFKDQLISKLLQTQAQLECNVHKLMKHDQIVQLYDWTENEKEYVMTLEFLNNANHFKEKIDDVTYYYTPFSTQANETYHQGRKNEILHYRHTRWSKLYPSFRSESYNHKPTKGYIHCDLKLENLFCEKIEGEMIRNVKIGDFGLVHTLHPQTAMAFIEEKCGTASYIAPEVVSNTHVTASIDIWSLGIILYKMSCGYKPTQIQGYKYGEGALPFRKFDWKRRSKHLQDIITKMLEFDPKKRPTTSELLQHSWFETE